LPHLSAFILQNVRGLAVLLVAVAVAGCGGAKAIATSSTPTTTTTTTTTTTAATTTTTTTTTAPITPAQPSTTSTTKTAASTPTGSINVRVPARFTIAADGSVTPPTITVPAHLPVELIVVSNGQPHRISLRTTTLTVKPHAQAEALIDGLKAGSYPLKVDGAPKGVLTIGGEPGP
jgi:hypothetical protein